MRLVPATLLLLLCVAACSARPSDDTPTKAAPATVAPPPEVPAAAALPTKMSCTARSNEPQLAPLGSGESGGTVVLVRARGHTFALVADEDDASIATIDLDSLSHIGTTKLSGKPAGLLATQDGRVVVAIANESLLEVLEPADEPTFSLTRRCLVEAPAEPVGLATTPDQRTLLVTSRWGHALSLFQLGDLTLDRSVDLPRDPTAVLSSSDGTRAFVTHAVGGIVSVVDLASAGAKSHTAKVGVESFSNPPLITAVVRPDSSALRSFFRGGTVRHRHVGGQSFSLVKSKGGHIYAPQVLVESVPPQGSTGGYGSSGSSAPAMVGEVMVLDESNESIALTPTPKNIGHKDCFLPRAAALDERSRELWVACLGIDSVVAYDASKSHPHSFETRRIAVPSGPTGIAVDSAAQRAVVFSQFDGVVSVIPLKKSTHASDATKDVTKIALTGRQTLPAQLALGRALFHSAGTRRIAIDGRACASCHPTGRDDGMTWTTPEGPRQTPILLGRLSDSAPYGWLGDRSDLPRHFARTLERLAGTGLSNDERDAIFAWVNQLSPPVDRAAQDPTRLARGKEIFESQEASCSGCHEADESTDAKTHDIGSGTAFEAVRSFDTPSLRFIAHSAPYYHDGRYATLGEMLKASSGSMGKSDHLAQADLDALVAYLQSRLRNVESGSKHAVVSYHEIFRRY